MGIVRRLIGIAVALLVAAAAAGAIAARAARERLVRRDDPEADEVALVAIFEPLQFRSRAQAFRGGTVDCWYGGGMIDLREATLDPAGATLRVKAIFGGGQIVVPDDWRVETRVTGIGGMGDTRPAIERPVTAPLLRVEGLAVFGGFGVSSTLPEGADAWMQQTAAATAARAEARIEATVETTEAPAAV
jgi:hypothetical protein